MYDLEFNIIDTHKTKKYLFENNNELYLKKDNSSQGRGVTKITEENFNSIDLFKYGDSVIQEPIVQSEWFDEILTDSVATLRITTVKGNDKKIKMGASYLRVGRQGFNIVERNATIRVPIIDKNGTLGEFGSDPNWKRHYKHPDSGFIFAGQKIPHFEKAVEKCEKIHSKLPHFSIIGWDISITKDGNIKIMEWNAGHPDIKFSEATTGPCFAGLGWENLHKN